MGGPAQHILTYAGIDLHNIAVQRDSTWRYKNAQDGSYHNSGSVSELFSFAYDDGSQAHQALARFIVDRTEAGNDRDACYAKNENGEYVKNNDYKFLI